MDYAQFDATLDQDGCCHSAGNHHVYVEVCDEAGQRLVAGFEVFHGATTELVPDRDKPPEEFPMNYTLWGGVRYGVRAVYEHPTDGARRCAASAADALARGVAPMNGLGFVQPGQRVLLKPNYSGPLRKFAQMNLAFDPVLN